MDQKSYSNLILVVVFSVLEIRNIIWMGSPWYSHEKHYYQIIRSPSKFYAYLFNKLDIHLQWSALSQSRGSECKYWHHFGDHVLIYYHHSSDLIRCPDTATSSKVRSRFLASGKRLFAYYLSSSLDKIWSSKRKTSLVQQLLLRSRNDWLCIWLGCFHSQTIVQTHAKATGWMRLMHATM